jgi:Domain of Unknown Function (DUF1080)
MKLFKLVIMKWTQRYLVLGSVAMLVACGGPSGQNGQTQGDSIAAAPAPETAPLSNNVLTEAEQKAGWTLLFDGQSLGQWRGAYLDSLPNKGWRVENGEIIVNASGGAESTHGGDIVTKEQYDNFEFQAEFMLTDSANSGIKYFVVEHQPKPAGSAFGLEFQVLDDEKHPDAKKGRDGNRTVGSLYDLITAQNKTVNPIGHWNHARIVVNGPQVEHWLNGTKVVGYERGSEAFRQAVAQSKYAAPDYNKHGRFGEAAQGHLLLQDHGDEVHYRNLKIRRLAPAK